MCRRRHGDVIFGNVDADGEALLVDVGEVAFRFLRVFVRHVQVNVVLAALLHFVVDGACHDVARGKRQARVILLHELLAVQRAEHGAIAAHGFGDEERGAVARMIQGRGVKLDELHVFHRSLGTVDHGNAVARSHQRVGGVQIYGFAATGSHDSHLGEEGVHLACFFIEHVSAVAFDARCVACHDDAQVVLRDDFHRIVVGKYCDVGMLFYGFDEAGLDFRACVVLMVQDAEFRVSAFAVQVEGAVGLLVEVHAPLDEFPDLCRSVAHYFLHGGAVADPVARNHGVFDVLLEVVHCQIGHRRDTSLCEIRVGLFHAGLADEGHASLVRHFQRETHSGYARADDEEIELSYHKILLCWVIRAQSYALSAFLVLLYAG